MSALLSLLAAGSAPAGYTVRCEADSCLIASTYLEFSVRKVGHSIYVQPSSLRPEPRPGTPEKIPTTQYEVVPDFCWTNGTRCHFLLGPGADVAKWSEQEDRADKITTENALQQLAPARQLAFQAGYVEGDAIALLSRVLPARPFLDAVRDASRRLMRSPR